MTSKDYYLKKCAIPSDINEHLPTLYKYALNCDNIVEMGVRWVVSTWPLLAAHPDSLTSIDIVDPKKHNNDIEQVIKCAKEENVKFNFILNNTLKIDLPKCDLLFIDTLHIYDQLKQELFLHANKVTKYIIMHDTVTFAYIGETNGKQGLLPAINEFINDNPHWMIHKEYLNNNGLTILKRSRNA